MPSSPLIPLLGALPPSLPEQILCLLSPCVIAQLDNPSHLELEGGPHSELLRSLMHVYESQAAVHIPIPVDAYQTIREDAELMLGRNVIIAPVADDDTFDAQEVVEGLANRGQGAGTINGGIPITIYIPDNKRDSFHEALRAHLYRRSRLVVEGTGRTAFWKGREPFMEPFMRPALSRSLSLP